MSGPTAQNRPSPRSSSSSSSPSAPSPANTHTSIQPSRRTGGRNSAAVCYQTRTTPPQTYQSRARLGCAQRRDAARRAAATQSRRRRGRVRKTALDTRAPRRVTGSLSRRSLRGLASRAGLAVARVCAVSGVLSRVSECVSGCVSGWVTASRGNGGSEWEDVSTTARCLARRHAVPHSPRRDHDRRAIHHHYHDRHDNGDWLALATLAGMIIIRLQERSSFLQPPAAAAAARAIAIPPTSRGRPIDSHEPWTTPPALLSHRRPTPTARTRREATSPRKFVPRHEFRKHARDAAWHDSWNTPKKPREKGTNTAPLACELPIGRSAHLACRDTPARCHTLRISVQSFVRPPLMKRNFHFVHRQASERAMRSAISTFHFLSIRRRASLEKRVSAPADGLFAISVSHECRLRETLLPRRPIGSPPSRVS